MERALLVGWNLVALAAAGLILANLVVAGGNSRMARETAALRRAVEERRPAETLLRQVTLAVAEGAVKDAALRGLLVKHKLKATVTVDGAAKEMP